MYMTLSRNLCFCLKWFGIPFGSFFAGFKLMCSDSTEPATGLYPSMMGRRLSFLKLGGRTRVQINILYYSKNLRIVS